MSIKLSTIIPIKNPNDFKLHLACWNGEVEPLDDYVSSWNDWVGWNTWRGIKDDFSRDFIFSLMDFYHEGDIWLFGGIFKVISRSPINYSPSYKVELDEKTKPLIGRLKVKLKRPSRAKAFLLEKYYDKIVLSEILKEPYTGEAFCGYENINHSFKALENIFKREKPDWKGALENVKGVYLITDTSNNKRYVGSAYGSDGIWSRWACYIGTGHGLNDELTKLIKKEGIKYAQDNFTFALLELKSMKIDDKIVRKRESYWKEVLKTRGKYGYNKN